MAQKIEKKGNWFARHKILTGLIVVIAIAVIASAAGGDKKKGDTAKNASNSSSSSETLAKIGEPARDGKFEFVIKNVKCGEPSVSVEGIPLSKSASGQYCLVDISVKNIGDKQQIFSESEQKLLNASGIQYSPDTTATLYNSNNSDVFTSEVNPGITVEGTIVYDIPKDQTPVTGLLHDSAYSNGVKVTLQ